MLHIIDITDKLPQRGLQKNLQRHITVLAGKSYRISSKGMVRMVAGLSSVSFAAASFPETLAALPTKFATTASSVILATVDLMV